MWVEAEKNGIHLFISLQSFDRNPNTGNFHTLYDRLGYTLREKNISDDYITRNMVLTDFELPLNVFELSEFVKNLNNRLEYVSNIEDGTACLSLSELNSEIDLLKYYNAYSDFNKVYKKYYGHNKHVGLPKNFSEEIVKKALNINSSSTQDFDGEKNNETYEIKYSFANEKTTFFNKTPEKLIWLKVLKDKIEIRKVECSEVKKIIEKDIEKKIMSEKNCERESAQLKKAVENTFKSYRDRFNVNLNHLTSKLAKAITIDLTLG